MNDQTHPAAESVFEPESGSSADHGTPIPGPRFEVYYGAETIEDLTAPQMGAVLACAAFDAPIDAVRDAFRLLAPYAKAPKPQPPKPARPGELTEEQQQAFGARLKASKEHNARYVPQLLAERGDELRAAWAARMPAPEADGHLWYAYRRGCLGALGRTPEHAWRALFESAIDFCASTDTRIESFDDLVEQVLLECEGHRLYRVPRTIAFERTNMDEETIEQMLSGPTTMGGAA